MKKETIALTTFLLFAFCMTGVTAIDSWGMDSKIIDGDKYVYNATVVIIDDPYHYYHYNRVVYENATVVTTTSNIIKVYVDGKLIPSPNGLPYRFSVADMHESKPHYTNMPACKKKEDENPVKPVNPVEPVIHYQKIGDVQNFFINSFGKSGKTFRDLPDKVYFGNMTFVMTAYDEPTTKDSKVHFKAVYEDTDHFYKMVIESTNPWLELKQSQRCIMWIIIEGTHAFPNFQYYQKYITDNDGFDATDICSRSAGGNFILKDGTNKHYYDYSGFIDYNLIRL